MFIGSVIVAGDRTRPDIDPGTDFGITQIGQVIRLAAFTQLRVLDFDKIANPAILFQLCSWASLANGPTSTLFSIVASSRTE